MTSHLLCHHFYSLEAGQKRDDTRHEHQKAQDGGHLRVGPAQLLISVPCASLAWDWGWEELLKKFQGDISIRKINCPAL